MLSYSKFAMIFTSSWRQPGLCGRLTPIRVDGRPVRPISKQNISCKTSHYSGNITPEMKSLRRSRLSPVSSASIPQQSISGVSDAPRTHLRETLPSPLSILPLSSLIRSLAVTTVSSSTVLLGTSMAVLPLFLDSRWSMLNPDRNHVLGYMLRKTIYEQFCAGETAEEVRERINHLKEMGYSGVILGYAKEVVLDGDEVQALETRDVEQHAEASQDEVRQWKEGTMQTVELAEEGDFVALKLSGAGRDALRHLLQGLPLPVDLEAAMTEICERCRQRSVRLLVDAEQHVVQSTIDTWVMEYQRRYNRSFIFRGKPSALVYNTYQAYLLSTPATLSRHLTAAQDEGFSLGVKLVRGAYLGSDPRHLIHRTKEDTNRAYDAIAASLINREYNQTLMPDPGSFPSVDLVLASHNRTSIQKAQAIRNRQKHSGLPMIEMVYGQLQGMADDVSCELVQESRVVSEGSGEGPLVYKYLVWGTVGQCSRYLLRRAQENRDAASRTRDMQLAVIAELRRRAREQVGYEQTLFK